VILWALRDYVAGISRQLQPDHLVFPLWEADVLRTPKFEHPVQCIHRDADLGRLTPVCAGPQAVANHPFEPADIGLSQSTSVVAWGLLPSHAAVRSDDPQVTISHRWCRLGYVARYGAGAWGNDDGRPGMTRGDLAVDAILVVSAVCGERCDQTTHLIEQGPDLRGIADIAGGQRRCCDLPGVGVHRNVQLAPGPPCLCSMLLKQPFA
jgi:hypothetical protein